MKKIIKIFIRCLLFINIFLCFTCQSCQPNYQPPTEKVTRYMYVEYDAQASWVNLQNDDAGVKEIQNVYSEGNTITTFKFDDALSDGIVYGGLKNYAVANFNHEPVPGVTGATCNVYLCSIYDYSGRESNGIVGATPENQPNPYGQGPNGCSFIVLGNIYSSFSYPGYTLVTGGIYILFDWGNYFNRDDCIPFSYWVSAHELGHQRAGRPDLDCIYDCVMSNTLPGKLVPNQTNVYQYRQGRKFCRLSKDALKSVAW